MSDHLIGSIDNGSVGEATIGSYTGLVGITHVAGSDTFDLAFRGAPPSRRPDAGTLDGAAVEIVRLRRSDFDRRMMIVTVRPIEAADPARD